MPGLNDNPATHHVQEQQRAQVMSALQKMAGLMSAQQKTVLKALGEMGIRYYFVPVMIDDVPTDCVVIPKDELMRKEYAYISGLSLEQLEGNISGEAHTKVV